MSTSVTFNPLKTMVEGLNIACDAAIGTIGPCGKNAYIDDAMVPKITNDGFTIISKIELKDKLKNMGVKVAKSATARTVDIAGDGTTTTAALLKAVTEEAMKRPENPMVIRNSLLKILPIIVKKIKAKSFKITKNDIKKVVLVSAEDEVLANAISDIFNKMGDNVRVDIEDSPENGISHEITEGYEAHCGFVDHAFVNEEKRARCVMKDVPVFVTEKKISTLGDIQPLLLILSQAKITQIVIVCDDIDPAVLGQLIANKRVGFLSSCVIRAQGDALKDIEACVGASRVSDSTGISFQDVTLSHFGHCKKITSDSKRTLFLTSDVSKSKSYATALSEAAAEERNQFISDRMMKRVAQLSGGVAVLRIGGPDYDREYLKDKADDAIKAARSALEEGIVEGGGMCLYRIAEEMKPKTVGEQIIKKALSAPLRAIIENSGQDYSEIVKNLPKGMGYDARKGEYCDLIARGIIDPVKVEHSSITNAVSSAANLITTHVAIYEYDEPKN